MKKFIGLCLVMCGCNSMDLFDVSTNAPPNPSVLTNDLNLIEPDNDIVPNRLVGRYEGDYCVLNWLPVKRPIMLFNTEEDAKLERNCVSFTAILDGRFYVVSELRKSELHIVIYSANQGARVYRKVTIQR